MIIDKFNSALPLVDFAVKAQDAVGDIEKVKIRQFKLSYSKTRTNKNRLNAQFLKCLEEVNQLLKGPTSLYTICVVSHLFVTKLEKTNLYRDVKLFFSPFKGDIALHFEIEDKIPYFMSASNELDTNGAVFAVKLGMKNFLGYQDTLSFDCEKNISKSGADWSLGWQYQTLNDNQIQFQLKQSNSQILPFLNSTNQEISASYKNDTVQWSLANCYRSNMMQKDDSVLGQYLYNEYLRNSDFLPSKAWLLNYSRGLKENLNVEDGITDGNKSKLNLQFGLPKCTTSPFVKAWLTHQYYIPLRDYRKKIPQIKEILKNSSLCVAFNYGLVWSPNLIVNDLFGNLQFRGFNSASRLNQSQRKSMDSFFKMDCKFVVHNSGSFKENNVQLFYYLSLFSLGQPQRLINNVRGSFGVGLQMPVGQNINLEALIPLWSWRRKYDRETLFQVRIQLDD